MTPERRAQIAARRAERRQMRRRKAWKAGGHNRPGNEVAALLMEQAQALVDRLHALEPPDPLLAQLGRAQEIEDARPNPDDPDDEVAQ